MKKTTKATLLVSSLDLLYLFVLCGGFLFGEWLMSYAHSVGPTMQIIIGVTVLLGMFVGSILMFYYMFFLAALTKENKNRQKLI